MRCLWDVTRFWRPSASPQRSTHPLVARSAGEKSQDQTRVFAQRALRNINIVVLLNKTATALLCVAQLAAPADTRPFAGPGLKPLVLRRFTCQGGRHVKAARG